MHLFKKGSVNKKYTEKIQKKYELKEVLGTGAFSEVLLAVHKETGKKICSKMHRQEVVKGKGGQH